VTASIAFRFRVKEVEVLQFVVGFLNTCMYGREELGGCAEPLFMIEGDVASGSFLKDVLDGVEVLEEGNVGVVGFFIILSNWDVEVNFGKGICDLEGRGNLGEVFD
jgi:hypothetical protein